MAEEQSARELPVLDRPTGVPTTFAEHAKLMFDLQVLAYQTDMTRVITFMMGGNRATGPSAKSASQTCTMRCRTTGAIP